MAATFKVQIFKHAFNSRPWSNVYLLDAADLLAAQDMAFDLLTAETQMHYDVVTYDRMLVSSLAPDDDVFEVTPLSTTGQLDGSGTDFLPLYCTLRVDFHAIGGGRPSRKYYRVPIPETLQKDGDLTDSAFTGFQSTLDTFMAALATASVAWVDPDGQTIDSAAVQKAVQMRQLHRKRRRAPAP